MSFLQPNEAGLVNKVVVMMKNFIYLFNFLLLFNYSCLHFLPTPLYDAFFTKVFKSDLFQGFVTDYKLFPNCSHFSKATYYFS